VTHASFLSTLFMLADVVRDCPQQDCCSTAGKMGKGESKESSVDVFEYGKGTLIPACPFLFVTSPFLTNSLLWAASLCVLLREFEADICP
jgi:hypothetical protein